MDKNHSDIPSSILDYSEKPQLFDLGETHFWDDPHISKSMVEAHLDPDTDAASGKPVTTGTTIGHFVTQCDITLAMSWSPGYSNHRLV